MNGRTVGDVMTKAKGQALKSLAVFAGVLVYAAMLAYTGVHNYTLLTAGVPEDLLLWAIVGVVALEISAAALPVALHYWTHAPLQRFIALAFYLVDLGLLWLNVVMDFARVAGDAAGLPGWAGLYLAYVAPATPLVAGLGWSLLWLTDPAQQERATLEALAASTRQVLAERVAEAAKGADVEALVQAAALGMARDVVSATLGSYAPPALPANGGQAAQVATAPNAAQVATEGEAATVASPNGHNPATG